MIETSKTLQKHVMNSHTLEREKKFVPRNASHLLLRTWLGSRPLLLHISISSHMSIEKVKVDTIWRKSTVHTYYIYFIYTHLYIFESLVKFTYKCLRFANKIRITWNTLRSLLHIHTDSHFDQNQVALCCAHICVDIDCEGGPCVHSYPIQVFPQTFKIRRDLERV